MLKELIVLSALLMALASILSCFADTQKRTEMQLIKIEKIIEVANETC